MDFSNRGPQPQTTNHDPLLGATPPVGAKRVGRTKNKKSLYQWISGGLIVVIVALFVAVVFAISFDAPKSESAYVYGDKLQAVFLNTGQVYFGNIKRINPQYLVLTNIFYLQTNNSSGSTTASTSNNNVSLVKLGCELHAPYDEMVINMNQVTFWENLQSSGQVAKAVAQYQKQYPNGQKCSTQSTTTAPPTTSVQNAPTSPAALPKKP